MSNVFPKLILTAFLTAPWACGGVETIGTHPSQLTTDDDGTADQGRGDNAPGDTNDDHGGRGRGRDDDGSRDDDGTPDQGRGDAPGSDAGVADTGVCLDDDGTPDQGSGDAPGSDAGLPRCVSLPSHVRLNVGDTFSLTDAFASRGPLPAEVLEVTMSGEAWRLAELQSGTPFVVEEADCTHNGNRSVGRDRISVRWRNDNGTVDREQLDLRYCGN